LSLTTLGKENPFTFLFNCVGAAPIWPNPFFLLVTGNFPDGFHQTTVHSIFYFTMHVIASQFFRSIQRRVITIAFLLGTSAPLPAQAPQAAVLARNDPSVPLEARVQSSNHRPQLMISGKPTLPMFYSLTDSPGGRWTWEEVPKWNLQKFTEIGVKQFCVSMWLEWIWTAPDHFDLELVRRQIRGVLDVCPDAAIMIRLHVNSPPWWSEQHPDELVQYADGPVEQIHPWGMVRPLEGDLERTPRHSMASLRWRQDSGAIVARLCRELARTPEGNHVVAFHLAAGVFHEWHYYGFIDHEPDTGAAMTAYFRNWLRTKYRNDNALRTAWNDAGVTLDLAAVPGMPEREQTSDGYFRDPQRERRIIDYFECHQLSVQESAESFCRIVKEQWPRPVLTGAFYGYYFTLFGRMATGGHLQIQRMLDSPWIDFLSGPQSYRHREMGHAGISRGLLESVALHGKLWMDEYDFRPGRGSQEDPDATQQLANIVAMERRCVIEPLIRGHGLWFYDFGPRTGRGWWDQPALLEQARELKGIFETRLTQPHQSAADVLLVMESDGFYYLSNNRVANPVTSMAIDDFTEDLFHTGAAVDMIYLFDLGRVDLSRYKAVILPNAFRLNETERKLIHEHVARGGRHLIWMSAPGYTDGEKLDAQLISGSIGIKVSRAKENTLAQVSVTKKNVLPETQYGFGAVPLQPLFTATDPAADALGQIGDGEIGLARKQLADSTAWFSSVPLRNPALIRSILRSAGVHLYQDQGDITYAANGMLSLHTLEGGRRKVTLRNGHELDFTLKPKSTILLDAATGEKLLTERDYVVPRGARN
jgi:hypothetical protein